VANRLHSRLHTCIRVRIKDSTQYGFRGSTSNNDRTQTIENRSVITAVAYFENCRFIRNVPDNVVECVPIVNAFDQQ